MNVIDLASRIASGTACALALASLAPAQIVLPPPPPVTVDVCGQVVFDSSCGRVLQAPDGARYAVSDWLDATLGVEAQVGDEVRLLGDIPFGLCAQPCEPGALCVFNTTITVSCTPEIATVCPGYSDQTDCPCGNNVPAGAIEGCANSTGVGARFTGAGSASIAADDLGFHVAQVPPFTSGMVISGGTEVFVLFRDGFLCAGPPTRRLEVLLFGTHGTGSTTSSFATAEPLVPGDQRVYQLWYRDPAVGPCGSGSNFTNAVRVTWQ